MHLIKTLSQILSTATESEFQEATPFFYFVGSAPATGDPGLDGYLFIADRNTDQKTPWGKTDVRASGDWAFDPGYSFYPTVHVRVTLEAREAGHSFTVHSRIADAPEMPVHSVAQPGAAGTNIAVLDIQVGSGLQFWITRDAESGRLTQARAPAAGTWAAGTNTSQTLTFSAVGCFPAPPVRGQWVRHRFRVNAGTRAHHTLSVRMDDGYTTFFNETEHSDPATDTLVPAYGLETIAQWGNVVLFNPLPIITFTAMIDRSRAITLRDDSIASGGGLAQDITVDPAVDPTDVFDGWVPMQPQTPDPTITIHVPSGRGGHGIALFAQANQPAGHPWPNPEPHYGWPSPLPTLQTVTVPGVDGMGSYELKYYSLTLSNPTPYHGGPFTLQDVATLDPHDVAAGENDLRDWFLREHPVDVQISTSRMDHHLRVRHPNGEFFEITHPVAADTSTLGPYRVVSSAPYYYFDATSSARAEMPWYVEDLDTGERIGPGPGQTHPDNAALIMWIAVMPPHDLTALADRAGIDLAWVPGQAATGGGFIIERRESMNTGGPFTPWHELARVGDGLPHWRDTRIAPGEYVIYRVRAYFGSGPSERHSAPSNRARAAMWIDRGGGIYGTPGGDDGTGPNSVVDPPGGDGGGDGGGGDPVVPGDGDSDGDPDNDDDGVWDIDDRYPDDPLRSEDIPVKFYGVIDLNSYLAKPLKVASINAGANQGKPLITIDDSNQVAFGGFEGSGLFRPPQRGLSGAPDVELLQHRTVQFKDGSILLDTFSQPLGTNVTRQYLDGSSSLKWEDISLTPVGITPIAQTAGGMYVTEWTYISGELDSNSVQWREPFTYENSVLNPYPPAQDPTRCCESDEIQLVSPHGNFTVINEKVSHADDTWHCRTTPWFGTHAFSEHAYNNNSGLDKPTFTAIAASLGTSPKTGSNLLWRVNDTVYVWNADLGTNDEAPFPKSCAGINDQMQVIGDLGIDPPTDSPDRGQLGFLWSPTEGVQTFHDLLPGKFRKQLRSAVPYLITNQDPETNEPTVAFTAEAIDPDGNWYSTAFLWTRNTEGDPVIEEIYCPGETGRLIPRVINIHHLGVAPEDPGSIGLMTPTFFEAKKITKGFDLPIVGDTHDQRAPGATSPKWVKDTDDPPGPEWWTVIPGEGADAARTNNNLKIVFSDGKAAPAPDLRLVEETGGFVENITPQAAMGASQDIGFKAKSIGSGRVPKVAILGLKRTGGDKIQKIPKLKVDILPKRKVKLAIWYLHDSVNGCPMIDPAFQNPNDIKDMLNEVFGPQACLEFEIEYALPLDVPFDLVKKDRALWMNDQPLMNLEYLPVSQGKLPLSRMNLILVRAMNGANLGSTPWKGDRSFVETRPFAAPGVTPPAGGWRYTDFLITCVHEIGHLLELSTHDEKFYRNPVPNHNVQYHDVRFFPMRDYYEDGTRVPLAERQKLPETSAKRRAYYGLMSQATPPGDWKWIRHEDWKQANKIAGDRFETQ